MQNNSLLFESLFKKNFNLKESKLFLEQIIEKYPYFSVAHFYLLQLTNKDETLYNKQAAKTAVHFNNPYWLNFQLKQMYISATLQEKDSEEKIKGQNEDNDRKKQSHLSDTQLPPKNKESVLNETELLFEPLHIVDYFASQGIKLEDAPQASDKLGKQLKSFTEWLKTMKKLHATKSQIIELQSIKASEEAELIVQKLAEKSNKGDEILTESMAEILAKQGKNEKAIEVYQKLSLLNPSKIAYFAAKIEQLKG